MIKRNISVSDDSLPYNGIPLTQVFCSCYNHLYNGTSILPLQPSVEMLDVWNQWNGMVEWNTGMEYWNDPNSV